MVDLFRTAVSGLSAAQRSLATTGHNIANVNTPGYSRQRVELVSALPQQEGGAFVGRGVDMAGISRSYDQFLTAQVRSHSSSVNQLRIVDGLTAQLGSLVGDAHTSLAPALQRFFDAAQDLATDPNSTPARRVLLSEGQSLAARFRDLDAQLSALRDNVNDGIASTVGEINALAEAIAQANQDIAVAMGRAGNAAATAPNDLLDQRDELLKDLSELVTVQTVPQGDGSVAVFIGTGQALVLGHEANRLVVDRSGFDARDIVIRYERQSGTSDLSADLIGGRAGGYLTFRRDVLDPAQNQLGLLATGLGETFNARHALGMDQLGAMGGALFHTALPRVHAHSANSPTQDTVTAAVADAGALQGSDYELSFDGAAYHIRRLADDQVTPLGGPGSYTVDGLDITIGGGAAVAGDRFLIRPTRAGAKEFGMAITDTRELAAALPILSQAALGNAGSGTISPGEVVDPAHPDLRNTVQLTFDDPPTTYSVVDLDNPANNLMAQPYLPGQPIVVNGWRVELSGGPVAGDVFQVADNPSGVGDNRNALALAGLQQQPLLLGGSSSYRGLYGQMVTEVGATGSRTRTSLAAQQVLLDQASADRDAVAGVNLDEEAADLLRFQQSYDASAQLIRVADSLFQTLLDVARR